MINYPGLLAIIASRVLTIADANLVMNSEIDGKEKLQKLEPGGLKKLQARKRSTTP